jgi:glycolate oxidase iron-sulfur subunit
MRTNFSDTQLADPHLAAAQKALRSCVHCGICTATCPTYVLIGDERDGPRGRIVMMQNMLELGSAPSPETVLHVDRCLSCLGCRTACPSGVDYARLVDTARVHIEKTYRRPLMDRVTRWMIANVLTHPSLAKLGVVLARAFAPIATRLPGKLGVMARIATKSSRNMTSATISARTGRRVALLRGCVQQALAPQIDEAVARILARRGIALVPLDGADCCGALPHHLGREEQARAMARYVIEAFERAGDVEAVLISASGCVSHMADYPHLFAGEPQWKSRAEKFANKVREFSQLVEPRAGKPPPDLRIAWQIPCSLQHGLKRGGEGEVLLTAAGFNVEAIPEGHLCCGSAGSYSLLQPEMADRLRDRKLANVNILKPDAIATANIGCLNHLSGPDAPPVVHLAELIDWAEGGPRPAALRN